MWLLDKNIKTKMESKLAIEFIPTAQHYEQQAQLKNYNRIVGDTAIINVQGVLTQTPDIFAALFAGGNTTYAEITESIIEAVNSPSIKKIQFNIDSPGGSVDGLFDLLGVLSTIKKDTVAVVSNLAASAAYAIASQAKTIIATNRAVRVGSVGVVVDYPIFDDEVSITSSNAPNKRPDVTTEEGKDVVREELDALEDLFIEAIALGRKTSIDNVRLNYGRGKVLTADTAVKLGMIDFIKNFKQTGEKMMSEMNLNPTAYAEAVSAGVDKERDRVSAHLTMGEASGDFATAIEAIRNGEEMTASLQAKYMAAGIKRNTVQARIDDNPEAVGVEAKTETPVNVGNEVAKKIAEGRGLKNV
jgi:ClpP class serine protease